MYAHEGGGENRTGYKSPRQVQGAIPGLVFFPSMACHTMAESTKAGCVFHLTNGKPVSSFLLSLVVETPCRWGFR